MNKKLFETAQILKLQGEMLELWSCFENYIQNIFSENVDIGSVIQINEFIAKYNCIVKRMHHFDATVPFQMVTKPDVKFEAYLCFQKTFLYRTYLTLTDICNTYQIPAPKELPSV